MASQFTHLHTHSHYSLLAALPKISDLVSAAKKCGMSSLALTDNGNLYGAIEFYKACKKENIKPIIGIDAYVALRKRHDKEAGVDNRRSRLVLLAQNETGYKNLIQLVTKSHLEGFYYKPRIDRELMELHHEGLIAILPSFSGETSLALKNTDREKAEEIALWYTKTFGQDNAYFEITHHPEVEGHGEIMKKIVELSQNTTIPLVAAHDVYYLSTKDRLARETLMKIQTNTDFGEGGLDEGKEDFSFIDGKTAEKYFKKYPEALTNISKIVDACNLELKLGSWVFPDFKVQSNNSYDEELRKVVYEALPKYGLKETKDITDRIEYELNVICSKGYASYFLVVSDLLRYAHEHSILTTTRGSAAGSLVSYLSGITNVNPIEYKLPFERFLNPERPSAPDIDMDIADNRRDEMIQYAKEKYGENKVAQIGTFGTMLARGVVRDVARALGHPYNTGDQIAKLIPLGSQGFPMTIDHAIEMTPELKDMYKSQRDVKEIIDLAKKIEGNARHISIHAAGVVISPLPLTEYIPLQFDPKGGKMITQYDMHAVEDAGLLKFDFLGIKNLSILADAVERAHERHGVEIDIENIPLDDKKTYDMLARGETMGLFQLNGGGMTRYLKELKPNTIHDINAMVALYRPGPMEVIPEYIKRKQDPSLVRYLDPRMEEYLHESYGLIVYQDDLLFSAIELAGYSWLEADKFRKAVGKKIPAEMAAQKEKFLKGIVNNGQTKEFAEKLWKLFEPFQSYGFNKAHAATYGKVAYQTSYMKANYHIEYMAALLTADSGNVEKIAETIVECNRMGIAVLPPDVNESFGDFTIATDDSGKECIRFGLHSIKNFGEGVSDAIISEREECNKFKSLADFLTRVQDRNLNRKSLEALIKCGALDSFEDRGKMMSNIEVLLSYSKEVGAAPEGQDSLFGDIPEASNTADLILLEKSETPQHEKLAWEKELLGLYVSGHPLEQYRELFEKKDMSIEKTKGQLREGMMTVVSGIVEEFKPIVTKRGERMAFLTIADFTGSIEVVLFPRIYEQYKSLIGPESCIAIKGRLSGRNGETSVIGEAVKKLAPAESSGKQAVAV